MRSTLLLCFGTAISTSSALACGPRPFDNLVTFGDSYTDNGRLNYYARHQGNSPPAGSMHPESNTTASGGLAWGQIAARMAGSRYLDYAVSGATCSNRIISRYFAAIGKPFPSIMDDQIPSFEADIKVGASALYANNRTAGNTVYAMWIGTNDLGGGAFLTDQHAPGTNITSFIECLWQVFDHVFATGGRRFVLLNEAPLHLAPLYVPAANGGTGDSGFWQTKSAYNQTQYQEKIMEYTTTVNTALNYGVPFHLLVKKRWPGAKFSVFDVHSLLTEISMNPAAYLDAPANSTGFYHHCDINNTNCVDSKEPMSSFMWYDELHPSERTDSIIARHFLDVVDGKSAYGITYH